MRLPKSFYERPLTPKEAQFATDNINIVWWYLDQQGLDRAEWFDVVIFRYLISVKRWFALPDLQKVKFVTVACNAMRSAIGNARRKSAKEPQTVSLYEPIPKYHAHGIFLVIDVTAYYQKPILREVIERLENRCAVLHEEIKRLSDSLENCHPLDRGFLEDQLNKAISKNDGTHEAREIVWDLLEELERLTGWHD